MKHLILADPWGFPERPKEIAAPLWVRAIAKVYGNVNPLWILRAGMLTIFFPIFVGSMTLSDYFLLFLRTAGSYGQWLVQKTRPDILRKFQEVVDLHSTTPDDNLMAQYIHQCNAQSPT